ncbi:isochorismate synthase [Bacillus testis]|uniref:isochorismate synthase n=1 Tax=Bacillus testis TaxID=1622072 RepID=UPI00067EF8A5|nr:isochorismate synthase [Bacillus testis]
MAIGLESHTLEGLQKSLRKANETKKEIMFSTVVKVNDISPLSLYTAGRDLFIGERFFWQEPTEGMAFTGLGKISKLQAKADQHRYLSIESQWKKILSEAVIVQDEKQAGTGPLLFGGFSFDCEKSQSSLWDRFGDNFFYVPQYMLTSAKGGSYLTINTICSPGDDMTHLVDVIKQGEELASVSGNPQLYEDNLLLATNEVEPEEWKQTVRNAVKTLQAGTMDKVVLARERRLSFKKKIVSEFVLAKLQKQQGTSFIFSLESGDNCFIGATPERLVKKQGPMLLSTCLAGSIARGASEKEDASLGSELLSDPKNLREHQYVVSMIRKALEEVCMTVNVPSQPELMKLKFIQHLYTPVTAVCLPKTSLLGVVEKLHPTPALGGLPQQQAVKWIREHERLERGLYGGPLGWIDADGNGEFAVALRSGLLQDNEASLFAGCGIVADSVAEEEYKETEIKFKPMINALGGAIQ